MKRWGDLHSMRFDKREIKTNLGEGNFIFVGSSCDMFADAVPMEWIQDTVEKMNAHNNRYLLQSKNPGRIAAYLGGILRPVTVCTTIETNRWYPKVMRDSPRPEVRAHAMATLAGYERYVTIEPIIDFDLVPMVELIKRCEPVQVNIGADSGRNNLSEPDLDKVIELVSKLNEFTSVILKRNAQRVLMP
jgi:DNA repair photolyase